MSNQHGVGLDRVRVERGIYRRASGRYAVCVMIDGKPRLRIVTATTVAEAREQRELLVAAARRGELPCGVKKLDSGGTAVLVIVAGAVQTGRRVGVCAVSGPVLACWGACPRRWRERA
jgi:hypothetical protein